LEGFALNEQKRFEAMVSQAASGDVSRHPQQDYERHCKEGIAMKKSRRVAKEWQHELVTVTGSIASIRVSGLSPDLISFNVFQDRPCLKACVEYVHGRIREEEAPKCDNSCIQAFFAMKSELPLLSALKGPGVLGTEEIDFAMRDRCLIAYSRPSLDRRGSLKLWHPVESSRYLRW
jgi:hypothetical protein